MTVLGVRSAIDWGELAPLRLRARQVAEGLYSGLHRSSLRGAGVEFGGYREYVPGDDLRWLDRRSLLLHDRLLIRQFETDTDRSLSLLVDASASMQFRGAGAPASKVAYAAVLAAALARIAQTNGDPVSVTFLGGLGATPVSRAGGREQFERILVAFESLVPSGDTYADPSLVDGALSSLVRSTRRGALLVILSDLLDWPDSAVEKVAALSSTGRVLTVVQTLDPAELSFPYSGTVRFRAAEGGAVVETDADVTRDRYIQALDALTARWKDAIVGRGGRFLRTSSASPPVVTVRDIVKAIR